MPKPVLLFLIATLSLVVIVYYPGLSGSFIFDDFPNIINNPETEIDQISLRQLLHPFLSGISARPLSMLSFTLERYFFGLNPFIFKLTNLVIHLINTILVFQLIQALLFNFQIRHKKTLHFHISIPALTMLITAAWALAPINLTAVLYVVQRMESLATMFMLAGLIAYIHGRLHMEDGEDRAGRIWVAGGLVLGTGLGILCKESAVMLPVYALLVEWLLFDFGTNKNQSNNRNFLIWLYTIILIIPGISGLMLYLPEIVDGSAYANRSFGLTERVLTESRVIWHYLQWIVTPNLSQLSLYHDAFILSRSLLQPWTTLFSILGLAGLGIITLFLRRQAPLIIFGLLWFFIMHLLVSTIIPLELVYEHRNYTSSLGIFLVIFSSIFSFGNRDSLYAGRWLLAVSLITMYGFITFMRAEEWRDPLLLAQFEAARQTESPRANYELGKTIIQLSPSPLSPLYNRAINSFKHAATLPRAGLQPLQALIYIQTKNNLEVDDNWWSNMKMHVQNNPLSSQDINALYSLINAQAKTNISLNTDKLKQILQAAQQKNPQRHIISTLYANFMLNVYHDYQKTGKLLQKATSQAPKKPQVWINLIRFQLKSGQTNTAEYSLSRLSELNQFSRLDEQIKQLYKLKPKGLNATIHSDGSDTP